MSTDPALTNITKNNHTPDQVILLARLSSTPKHINDIAQESGQTISSISITLMELELSESIQNIGSMKYIVKS